MNGSLLSVDFLVGLAWSNLLERTAFIWRWVVFSFFLSLPPFCFWYLARRWEGVTVSHSFGPLLSLVFPLKEEGNFVQAALSSKCDCLNCFPGCLPSWGRKEKGCAGKEQLKLMGWVRGTYRPSRPCIDFKGYREGSFRRLWAPGFSQPA